MYRITTKLLTLYALLFENEYSAGAYQVPTGFEIVQKVWEFAPWP